MRNFCGDFLWNFMFFNICVGVSFNVREPLNHHYTTTKKRNKITADMIIIIMTDRQATKQKTKKKHKQPSLQTNTENCYIEFCSIFMATDHDSPQNTSNSNLVPRTFPFTHFWTHFLETSLFKQINYLNFEV